MKHTLTRGCRYISHIFYCPKPKPLLFCRRVKKKVVSDLLSSGHCRQKALALFLFTAFSYDQQEDFFMNQDEIFMKKAIELSALALWYGLNRDGWYMLPAIWT